MKDKLPIDWEITLLKIRSRIFALAVYILAAVLILSAGLFAYDAVTADDITSDVLGDSGDQDGIPDLIGSPTTTESGSFDEHEIEDKFIAYLNEERSERGLEELSQEDYLRELGESHTEDMAENDYFSHTDSEGRDIEDRYRDAGLLPRCELPTGENSYYPGAENLAQFYTNERLEVPYQETTLRINDEDAAAKHLFEGWMYSDGHREAMLVESATEAGLGITITDDGEAYAALMLC